MACLHQQDDPRGGKHVSWDLNLGKRNSNIHTLPTNQAPVDMNSRDSLVCSPENHYDYNRKAGIQL